MPHHWHAGGCAVDIESEQKRGLERLCQLICIDAIINERGRGFRCRFSLGSQRWGRNLSPALESFLHLLTIGGSGESMPVWTEMLGDGSCSL